MYFRCQVAPAELEALLITHPAIADVAVIGIPDEAAGEIPKAFVVTKSNAQVTEEEVKVFVKGTYSGLFPKVSWTACTKKVIKQTDLLLVHPGQKCEICLWKR